MTATPHEQRAEALRRRRNARFIGFVVIVAALTAAAIFVRPSEDDNAEGSRRVDRKGRAEAACGAEAPPTEEPPQYDEPPEPALEEGVDYRAVISTSCGQIALDLLEAKAPINVNNFVFLAREGFYDGLTFHRVELNAIIAAGDPEGTGSGGPGYTIPNEYPDSPREYVYGTVGMANEGPDTAGSEFFVIVHDPEGEDGYDAAGYRPDYTIFGKVDLTDVESLDTLEKIAKVETKVSDDPAEAVRPLVPVYIESVEILER